MSEWISVDDRLPEKSRHKDSCNPYYFIKHKKYGVMRAMFTNKGWCPSYSSKVIGRVTHWMPLPEPPKGRE